MNTWKDLWEKFERGDWLTLLEVRTLARQTGEALPYLRGRASVVGTGAVSTATTTLVRLQEAEAELVKMGEGSEVVHSWQEMTPEEKAATPRFRTRSKAEDP